MKNIKILALVFLVIGAVVYFTASPARTKLKAYYSGDAINYNGTLVVASTDSEALEIFKLGNNGLERTMHWRPYDSRFSKDDSFYGVKLNIENRRLYAYVISGFSIYKYDISNLNSYTLVSENKNTYWEWYNKIDKFGDNIVTISAKGVKVWSNNLEVIDSYNVDNDTPYNISSAGHNQLVFNLKESDNKIEIFDTQSKKVYSNININFYGDKNNRGVYYDAYDDHIYLADDLSVKKVSMDGSLKGTFEHLGFPGYDVRSTGNEYLYFSNGLGIVKLRKSDMSVVTSLRTGGVVAPEGWAMGLKVVATNTGDKVVVFNNSSILILDSNLSVLGHSEAGNDDKRYVMEQLYLNLSDKSVDSGSQFEISGGGFLPKETLVIDFYNQKIEVRADDFGRFNKVLETPSVAKSSSRTKLVTQSVVNDFKVSEFKDISDIKVTGNDSSLTYSITIELNDVILR
ncbi:MAG: hypothetical protein WCZ12_03740 [Patescibacteria group bacterium]